MRAVPIGAAQQRRLIADLRAGQFEAAETLLVSETEKQPSAAALFAFAGRVFFLDKKYPNCAIAYSKADRLIPLAAPDRFTLSMAFLALRRQDWARREFERLRSEYPGEALYAYWLGKLDFDGQDLRAAMQNFEAAIRLDPSFVKAHDMLAVAEGVDGREEEAADAHELDPSGRTSSEGSSAI